MALDPRILSVPVFYADDAARIAVDAAMMIEHFH